MVNNAKFSVYIQGDSFIYQVYLCTRVTNGLCACVNKHRSTIELVPSKTLEQETEQEEKERLERKSKNNFLRMN